MTTVKGGDFLILHGRGKRRLTPNNRSAMSLLSLSSSASHYSFLEGTYVEVCSREGSCFDGKARVARDGRSTNVSLPTYSDLCKGKEHGEGDGDNDDDDEQPCPGDESGAGLYLTLRITVPVSPLPAYFPINATVDCQGYENSISQQQQEQQQIKTCVVSCGKADFSGCPSASHGGALYLLSDTCAEFEQNDYRVCLDPATASSCGYHVRKKKSSTGGTSTSTGKAAAAAEPECEPCPPAALCPGGARIWPRLGYWVDSELPPMKGSGVSANPVKCPAPAAKRCLGWGVETATTRCGPGYKPESFLCSECATGRYSTMWNRSCSPCGGQDDDADGAHEGYWEHIKEAVFALVFLLLVLLLFALGVLLVVLRVGGNRSQGVYRARRFLVFSVSSLHVLAQCSQQATGYEDPAVLKLYGYLNLVTTLDSAETLPQECWRDDSLGPFFAPNAIMSVLLVGFALWAWLCFVLPSERRWWSDGVCRCSFKLQQKLLVGMTLLYPLGVRTALKSVVCVRVVVPEARSAGAGGGQGDTMSVLRARPTIPCFGSAHAANGVLGYATLVFVCLGFPACLIWLVRCSKQFDQGVVASVRLKNRKRVLLAKNKKRKGGGAEVAAAGASGNVEMTRAAASFYGSQVNPYFNQAVAAAEGAGDGGGGNKKSGAASCSSPAAATPASAAATTSKPRRHSHVLVGQPTLVQAFVRYNPEHLTAFRPLVESDYRLAFLGFRPAYLYLLLLLSAGTVVFPPSSPHAVPRLCFSLAVIVLYYTAFLYFRPLRRSRRWILPVHMSIFVVGVLALALSAITEISDLEGGENMGLVRTLSFVIVVGVALIIGVVIPAAAMYDLVTGARREILTAKNQREVFRKESDLSVTRSGRLEGAAGGSGRDKGTFFDEATGAYYTHNTRSGSTHWVAESGEQGVVGAYAERETHLDDATGAYYTHNTRSGSTHWVAESGEQGVVGAYAERETHLDDATGAYYTHNTRSGSTHWVTEPGGQGVVGAYTERETHLDNATGASDGNKEAAEAEQEEGRRKDPSALELVRRTRLKRVRSAAEKMRKEMLRRAETDVLSVPGYDPRYFSVNSTRGEWSVVVDDRSGKTMYYNHGTREVRAARPEGWVRMLAKSTTPTTS